MRDKRAAKCFKFYNNNLVLVIICFSRFCFARFGGFVSLVSVVSFRSFRWFRFVVSGFSTCPHSIISVDGWSEVGRSLPVYMQFFVIGKNG